MPNGVLLNSIENIQFADCTAYLDNTITHIKSSVYINMVLMPKTKKPALSKRWDNTLFNAYRVYKREKANSDVFLGARSMGRRHMSG